MKRTSLRPYEKRSRWPSVLLAATAILFAAPIYMVLQLSLKSQQEVYTGSILPTLSPTWSNYSRAWQGSVAGSMESALLNNLVVTVGSLVPLILMGSLCGYALARRTSKMSQAGYYVCVAALVLPTQLAIIPLYVAFKELNLLGTLLGLIIFQVCTTLPLSVFMYTGFIRALPREYEEAAFVDGTGAMRTFIRVVFPLVRPATGTVAVFGTLVVWNDFFTPLLFLSGTGIQTLPTQLYAYADLQGAEPNVVFASVVIACIPMVVFFAFAQRHLVRGFANAGSTGTTN